MTIKEIKEEYSDIYENLDKKAISWITKNKKVLKSEFKKKFPKSPYEFVAQFKTKRGTMLINNYGEIRKKGDVSYLTVKELKSLGCEISL